jgi:hypothetical protein
MSFPDSIFKVERGRMRNEWYPHKKAEYMTVSRFSELGLTRDDIGERDTTFGTVAAAEPEPVAEPVVPTMTVLTTSVCNTCLCSLSLISPPLFSQAGADRHINNSPKRPIPF